MASPFEPVSIVEECVYSVLAADATIDAAIGADNIWPAFSPPDAGTPHLVQDFAGPELGIAAIPMGQAVAQMGLRWDVTAWNPGMSRQVLRPIMKAVQAALTGPSIRGKHHAFVSALDGSAWDITCSYLGPVVAPIDVAPSGVWQRVSGRFLVQLRQKE